MAYGVITLAEEGTGRVRTDDVRSCLRHELPPRRRLLFHVPQDTQFTSGASLIPPALGSLRGP